MSARRLGSTEIAAVAALYLPQLAAELPKTKTAGDVWLRLVHGLEVPRNSNMARGLSLEPWALDYYAEHIGRWWRELPLGEFWTVPHPRYPDFTASPDAYFDGGVLEVKTQSEWARKQWGTPGTSEMANCYLYQCAWLMACCDKPEAHVLCVFGHDVPVEGELATTEFQVTEPAVYRVERDAEVESMLLDLGERFLNEFVRTGIPPPVKPAHNRRRAKELVANAGRDAVEWYEQCEERERSLTAAREAEGGGAGDEAGGGDGLR